MSAKPATLLTEALELGYTAFHNTGRDANPFPVGTDLYLAWDMGWRAEEEAVTWLDSDPAVNAVDEALEEQWEWERREHSGVKERALYIHLAVEGIRKALGKGPPYAFQRLLREQVDALLLVKPPPTEGPTTGHQPE